MNKHVRHSALLLLLLLLAPVTSSVEIHIWDYVPWRVAYYEQYAEQYMAENPEIAVHVQHVPETEYIDKIVVGMVTGHAPSMFSAHPQWVAEFHEALAPFPHDLFPPEQLSQDLLGYSQLLQNGQAYYYPLGMQGAVLFINEDHFNNAGLAAPPRTWKEAYDMGRQATQRSEGITEVAGFFFDYVNELTHDFFVDLNYQHGGKLYKNDGQEVAFNETPGIDALHLIMDMYESGISGHNESLSFVRGEHVMLYSYAWRQQQLALAPDIRWTVAPLPSLTGDLHEGIGRMQYYFGMAVPRFNDEEEVRAAFEFLAWAYGNDERLMDLNSRSGTLPSRMSIWNHPEVADNPVLRTLTQTLPLSVAPGEFPRWMMEAMRPIRTALATGTADPVVAMHEVARQINVRLQTEPLTWVAE